jgi:RNA polymerase sigma-70 factor (ECF subfamily)
VEEFIAAEQSTPSEQAQRNEAALQLEDALAELPERQREAVVLKHIHGWSLAAIREHLGVSTAAVAGLLNRGLKGLRDLLPGPE